MLFEANPAIVQAVFGVFAAIVFGAFVNMSPETRLMQVARRILLIMTGGVIALVAVTTYLRFPVPMSYTFILAGILVLVTLGHRYWKRTEQASRHEIMIVIGFALLTIVGLFTILPL